jgi:hypothetical protein
MRIICVVPESLEKIFELEEEDFLEEEHPEECFCKMCLKDRHRHPED